MQGETLRNRIDKLETVGDLKNLFNRYNVYLDSTKYRNPDIQFASKPGEINAFVIRNNEIGISNSALRNNDYLIVTKNETASEAGQIFVFSVTADPKDKAPKRAFAAPCQWIANIGYHHYLPWRICLRQDNDDIWVRRYKADDSYYEEKGRFTIHIHDTGGFFNSSLGCVILANDDSYNKMFKPLLTEVKKYQKNVPVSLLDRNTFFLLTSKILNLS